MGGIGWGDEGGVNEGGMRTAWGIGEVGKKKVLKSDQNHYQLSGWGTLCSSGVPDKGKSRKS